VITLVAPNDTWSYTSSECHQWGIGRYGSHSWLWGFWRGLNLVRSCNWMPSGKTFVETIMKAEVRWPFSFPRWSLQWLRVMKGCHEHAQAICYHLARRASKIWLPSSSSGILQTDLVTLAQQVQVHPRTTQTSARKIFEGLRQHCDGWISGEVIVGELRSQSLLIGKRLVRWLVGLNLKLPQDSWTVLVLVLVLVLRLFMRAKRGEYRMICKDCGPP
jgi:hypothetical protein